MVSFQGSFTSQASTTAAATAIRTQMQTTIPTHSAWSLVESSTTSGALPVDVYKCAAAGSGLSADFYVAVYQSAASLFLQIAEGYNSSTHRPKRCALNASTALQTLQADGGLMPATTEIDWAAGTYNPGGGALSAFALATIAPAVTDDYFIVVAKDGLALSIRTAAQLIYAGAYDSLLPTPATNDPLPLCVWKSNASGAALRQPMKGSASIGLAGNLNGSGNGQVPNAALLNNWNLGTVGAAATDNFDFYVGNPTADKFGIQNSWTPGSATVGRNINGWLRGSFRLVRGIAVPVGAIWNDTATVDGTTYFCVVPSATQLASFWVENNPA